jgi:DNA topoisomerase-1
VREQKEDDLRDLHKNIQANEPAADMTEDEAPDFLPANPAEAAAAAGLYYVMEGEPGITRIREGDTWVYLDPRGKAITGARRLARIQSLAIPPAWTAVWVCSKPNGHIQATGRDAKGRKQYRYHPQWNELRGATKFDRIVAFGEALPAIRARVAVDLRRVKFDHQKVTALVVRLLEQTLIRIGNPEYARKNNSYGLTTLLDEHITVDGQQVHLSFIGKKGIPVSLDLKDRSMARLVKRCQDLPGQQLFQYLDVDGQCCQSVTSGDVNDYLRAVSGRQFSAKDFRTWGGTVLAAAALYHLGPAGSEKEAEKIIVRVVKEAAEALGNTPAVCRKYYISPAVLEAYRSGALFETMTSALLAPEPEDPHSLSSVEQGVLALLRQPGQCCAGEGA